MRSSSDTLISARSRRSGTARFQALVLVLLAVVPAVLSLAIPRPAKAAGPPTVTEVKPSSGPLAAGTSVTITGTNLTGATKVKFGSAEATGLREITETSITVAAPAGTTGTVDVTVTTPEGTSATGPADHFTYVAAPTVTEVKPSSGPTAGGTSVTITGTNLTGATAVKFGSTNAASFHENSATMMTAPRRGRKRARWM